MGYRELLKTYIRHLELVAGDNYIDQTGNEPVLTRRDLGELRTLAAEVCRESFGGSPPARVTNYNARMRVLMQRHAIDAQRAAQLMGVPGVKVRRWRTDPKSSGYVVMTEAEFTEFESALTRWLENGGSGSQVE